MPAPTKKGWLGGAPDAATIEAEIERIKKLKPEEVRALWRETFKRDVPKALTRDLLVRAICWHIQEQAFGGHSPAILKLLASYAKGQPMEADRLRRLKPGTELVREYQGERHIVVITPDGYRWRAETYPSLSAVARAITGSNWNGPRFFGLREAAGEQKTAGAPSSPPGHRRSHPLAGEGAPTLSTRPGATDKAVGQATSPIRPVPSARMKPGRMGKGSGRG